MKKLFLFIFLFLFISIPQSVFAIEALPYYSSINDVDYSDIGMPTNGNLTLYTTPSKNNFNITISVSADYKTGLTSYPYVVLYFKSGASNISITRNATCNQSCFSTNYTLKKIGSTTLGGWDAYQYALVLPISKFYTNGVGSVETIYDVVEDVIKFTNTYDGHDVAYEFTGVYIADNNSIVNSSYENMQEFVNNATQNTQNIINNQNQNSQNIINNQNQNKQDIINNQNQNSQNEIESEKENTQDIINNQEQNKQDIIDNQNQNSENIQNSINENFNNCRDSVNLAYNVIYSSINHAWGTLLQVPSTNIEKGKTYTVSVYLDSEGDSQAYWNTDSGFIPTKYFDVKKGLHRYTFTFNALNTGTDIGIILSKSGLINGDNYLITPSKLQIEEGSFATNYEDPNTQVCQNRIDETNDKLNDLNDNITNDSTPDLDFDVVGWLPANTVDSLITLPLSMLNEMNSSAKKSCKPYQLAFIGNTTIEFPCIGDYLSNLDGWSDLINFIDLSFGIFLIYKILMSLYKDIQKVLSLNQSDDELGGID